ncbi:MAG: polysaccharide deacetylase [Lachnospiraceae bacterium]|jgi:peptidoglycan/xylan/chitin deacetylase (PgdA/CDA1 family)|nr:polysaccharide deacetylase [Lachnospiraceae bacterium]MDE6815009.1 polysaccharide deacetylase [Lachnospiraceae bacterium]
MEETSSRRERVNRLKRAILAIAAVAVMVPTVVCVIFGLRTLELSGKVKDLEEQLFAEKSRNAEASGVYTMAEVRESSRDPEAERMTEQRRRMEEAEEYEKKVYLTFDDGPSSNTDAILDILREYDVKATFFVVGKTDERSKAAYQRIVAEGHTLAMHSYSHNYSEVYASKESFINDLTSLQEYLYEVTGVWPRFYRFPGGSSNVVSQVDIQELIGWLEENGITYFDWNTASGDAVSEELSSETIVNNCLANLDSQRRCMILMHDAQEKQTTVEALPEIISRVRRRGDAYFLSITDDTVPIQHLLKSHTKEDSTAN